MPGGTQAEVRSLCRMENAPVANPTSTDTMTVPSNDAATVEVAAPATSVAPAASLTIGGRLLDPALLASVAATVDISAPARGNGAAPGHGPAAEAHTAVDQSVVGGATVDQPLVGGSLVDGPAVDASAGACPFPSLSATAATCPFPGLAGSGSGASPMVAPNGTRRTPADMFMRRLLRIPNTPTGLSNARVLRTFQKSMMVSAVRCTLTYIIFPFVLPGIGFLKGVGPAVGIVIGSFALVCDTFTIRRFFVADHKWRWQFSAIAVTVMGLLLVLLAQDVFHVIGNLTG